MCTATMFSHAGTIEEEVGPEDGLDSFTASYQTTLEGKAYDIPLLLSLKQLLSNRFIFEGVSKHGKLYIDTWYEDLCIKCC